ncbi:glycosyltransferase, partial [Nitrospinae bacterium AH_259_B05_G02_I21]|nr:glycosyltransferase [Nitrospinae bacterium AH_259_B05_G02_I21]
MRLLLIGSGKLEGELRAEADRLGVASRVDFLGTRSDMPELFAAMDCFVLPSKRDSFPVVLLEAAAAGLPCVATDDGGNPESVIHERTGLLVPVDDPKALAEAVVSVLDDPERARRWGAAGRAKIERLHTARVM